MYKHTHARTHTNKAWFVFQKDKSSSGNRKGRSNIEREHKHVLPHTNSSTLCVSAHVADDSKDLLFKQNFFKAFRWSMVEITELAVYDGTVIHWERTDYKHQYDSSSYEWQKHFVTVRLCKQRIINHEKIYFSQSLKASTERCSKLPAYCIYFKFIVNELLLYDMFPSI